MSSLKEHFGKPDLDDRTSLFERVIWPHSRAAYQFARWLVRNERDAEDVAQEALLKALRAVDSMRGEDARAWLLAIVRNTAMNFMTRHKPAGETQWIAADDQRADHAPDPERTLLDRSRSERVRTAIANLQPEFREAIVLREIEGLAYKEIGFVLKIPVGTVMSRLSRARALLARELSMEGADL